MCVISLLNSMSSQVCVFNDSDEIISDFRHTKPLQLFTFHAVLQGDIAIEFFKIFILHVSRKTHLVNCCSTNDQDLLHRVCYWGSRQQVKGSLQAGAEVVGTFRRCAASKKHTPMYSLHQFTAPAGPQWSFLLRLIFEQSSSRM